MKDIKIKTSLDESKKVPQPLKLKSAEPLSPQLPNDEQKQREAEAAHKIFKEHLVLPERITS